MRRETPRTRWKLRKRRLPRETSLETRRQPPRNQRKRLLLTRMRRRLLLAKMRRRLLLANMIKRGRTALTQRVPKRRLKTKDDFRSFKYLQPTPCLLCILSMNPSELKMTSVLLSTYNLHLAFYAY